MKIISNMELKTHGEVSVLLTRETKQKVTPLTHKILRRKL